MMNSEIENEISRLKKKLQEVRLSFEKYFCGNEKRPPVKEREALKKDLSRLKQIYLTNAALKFQVQSLGSSFNTLESHWEKTCRLIEEGKYKRDQFRSRQMLHEKTSDSENDKHTKSDSELSKTSDDLDIEGIYNNYIHSLKEHGQIKLPTKEGFTNTLKAKYLLLREKYEHQQIHFQIELKEGKPTLKAVVKQIKV